MALKMHSVTSQKTGSKKGLDDVISLLLQMMTDFHTQMQDDKGAWESYQEWSEQTESDKTSFVQEQEALVMSKTALMNANEQQVQKLTGEISKLGSDIAATKNSIKELTQLRHEEHLQHEEELADLTKTIDAVNKAIEILEGHYAASGAALSEIKKRVQYAMSLTDADSHKDNPLTNFIQQAGPDWLGVDGSKYNTYEKQGGAGGVIGTLNDLRSTLDQNKQESIEKENESRRQYEDTKASKEAELSRMKTELGNKQLEKTEAESTIVSCRAAIDEANKNIGDAKSYLEILLKDRETFKAEFDSRTRMRNDEMAATQAALDAFQAVSAGAKSTVGGLIQESLIQLTGTGRMMKCPRCQSEMKKLVSLSTKLHSSALMEVASQLTQRSKKGFYEPAGFEPVKDLLRQLITRLEEEQSAETSHHDWCETEKATSVEAQGDREKRTQELQTEIEFLTTNTAQLKTELEFLAGELARVKAETEEATRQRNEAHEVFVKAKKDHDEVIGAVEKAMQALGGQYALLQAKAIEKRSSAVTLHKQAAKGKGKQSPFSDYQSGSSSGGSAIDMLQDLLSRYSAARTQLVGDEEAQLTAYKALMKANKQFMTDTENTHNSKMAERRAKLNKLANGKDEVKTNFVELQEITAYLQDLRPSCDDIRSTFEERKRRREAEIAALKECLEVLSDPSAMSDV